MRELWWLPLILWLGCEPQLVDAIESGGAGGRAGSGGGAGSGGEAGEGGQLGGAGAGGSGASAGEAGAAGSPDSGLRSEALLHRYSFDGVGTQVTDEKGGAHGTLIATELDGSGHVLLAGVGSGQYVDLPDGLISGLGDATFESWVSWEGGGIWQRIFDFGDTFLINDYAYGNSYLFLTAQADSNLLRAAYSLDSAGNEISVDGSSALAIPTPTYLAVVADDTNDALLLYRDGELEGSVAWTAKLANVNDINNYLGRSQFQADAEFGGSLDEFRIYDAALSAEEIRISFEAGPDAVFPMP